MTIVPADAEPEASDALLLAAVVAGDEAAFRALYRRHTPRLRMLVLRVVGGHEPDADDVVQESWIRAVAGAAAFRGESQFGRWLNGIGIRAAWEAIRRQRNAKGFTEQDEPAIDPPDSGQRLDLEAALRLLPDAYRAVVVLHDVEGFGHQEIAESLGIAVGTSRSHLSRARQALRSTLRSYERILK